MYKNETQKQKHYGYLKIWRANNRDKVNSYVKKWKARNKHKIAAYAKKYRLLHPDKVRMRQQVWNAKPETKEKMRLYNQAHRKTPEYKLSRYKRSAKERNIVFNLSISDVARITSLPCSYCGSSRQVGIDRVRNTLGYIPTNVVPACWPCNRLKKSFDRGTFINVCIAVAKFHAKL